MKSLLHKTGFATILLIFCLAQAASAVDVEKESAFVQKKVKEVYQLIDEQGLDEAIIQVNDPDGNFHWGSDYVYLMDLEVNILAHPTQHVLIGRNLLGLRDPVTGVPFFVDMFEHVNMDENAEGWLEYYWAKPDGRGGFYLNEEGERKPFLKRCYYMRKDNVVIFAGFYLE